MLDLVRPQAADDLGGAVRRLRGMFRKAGLESAALDARLLVSHAAGLSPEETIAKSALTLTPAMAARVAGAAERRLAGEPVSRIVGHREFWGLRFGLSPHTLDPRPETELLAEAVLNYVRGEGLASAPLRILDLGTGSGCLLGALLSELPLSSGVGVDLSEDALLTARENLRRLGLLHRSAFLCASWVSALSDACFDVIVGNPPYIATSEIAGLGIEVRDHDPHLALDGGKDGLEAFRAILSQVFRVLRDKGFLVLETGCSQPRTVCDMMIGAASGSGSFEVRILTDLGGMERAVAGVRQRALSELQSKKKVGNPALSG